MKKSKSVRCLVAIFTLVLLSVEARADEPDADVRGVIDRGLTFLAKDHLAWMNRKSATNATTPRSPSGL